MSYILEALKKADQERTVGKVPDLDSGYESLRPASRRSRWIWFLGVLLVINGVLVATLMWRNDGTEDASDLASAGPVPDSKTGEPVATIATRPRVALQPRPPAAHTPERAYVPPPPRPAVPGVAVRGTPVPAPVIRPSAPAAPAESSGSLPDWDDLSLEFRSGFTVPRIDVHVYDTNPQHRFILVNLKKFREGDRLESGALLKKITPEGVQLSFGGKQFIYRQ